MSRWVLSWPVHLLSIHYWYTRLTSIGINRTSVYMISLGALYSTVSSFASLAPWKEQFEFWISFFFTLVVCVWYTIPTILALKLVSPIALVWKRWVPVGLLRIERSHRERAFLRSDVKIPILQLLTVSRLSLGSWTCDRHELTTISHRRSRSYLYSVMRNSDGHGSSSARLYRRWTIPQTAPHSSL
jgi:hypothetical protein